MKGIWTVVVAFLVLGPRVAVCGGCPAKGAAAFDAGMAAHDRGDCGSAVACFERFLDTKPGGEERAVAAFFAGECSDKLGRRESAIRNYDRVGNAAPGEFRTKARDRIRALTLAIANDSDAAAAKRCEYARRGLDFVKEGRDADRMVEVREQMCVGRVSVRCAWGGEVRVDGVAKGNGAAEIAVTPGSHVVACSNTGCPEKPETVEIALGDRREMSLDGACFGAVSVDCGETGANVLVDGEFRGTSPADVRVMPGSSQITCVKNGFVNASATISVKAEEPQRVMLAMSRARPSGAASAKGAKRESWNFGRYDDSSSGSSASRSSSNSSGRSSSSRPWRGTVVNRFLWTALPLGIGFNASGDATFAFMLPLQYGFLLFDRLRLSGTFDFHFSLNSQSPAWKDTDGDGKDDSPEGEFNSGIFMGGALGVEFNYRSKSAFSYDGMGVDVLFGKYHHFYGQCTRWDDEGDCTDWKELKDSLAGGLRFTKSWGVAFVGVSALITSTYNLTLDAYVGFGGL